MGTDRIRHRRWPLVLAGALVASLGTVADAAATPPGANGLLLYTQKVDDHEQLFTVGPNGRGTKQLTQGPSYSLNADWSPDGRWIVLEHIDAQDTTAGVAIMRADGSHLRVLTPTGYQGDPSFTPDGKSIVFVRTPLVDGKPSGEGVFIMRRDGTGQRRLTTNPFSVDGACGCEGDPNVSPNGKTITFLRTKVEEKLQALFAVRPDGTGLRQLTSYELEIGTKHDWSPDGKRILFTTHADPGPDQSANVATMAPDGSHMRALTHFEHGEANAFGGSYSPDGRWIVLRIERGGDTGLYRMRPDGTGLRRLTTSDVPQSRIDWGPRSRTR